MNDISRHYPPVIQSAWRFLDGKGLARVQSAPLLYRLLAQATLAVKQYVDAGLNHLVFHAPGHDQRRFLELFERDLAQPLRRLGD